jgi:hypothetical protein
VLNDPLQIAFSALPGTQYIATSTGADAAEGVPPNVHVLTSKWLNCSTVLVRLSHMFQSGENPALSRTANVKLAEVAKLLRLDVKVVQEATLFGERLLQDSDCMQRNFSVGETLTKWLPPLSQPPAQVSFLSNRRVGHIPLDAPITLQPMQIRAFFFTVQREQRTECAELLQHSHDAGATARGGRVNMATGAAARNGLHSQALPGPSMDATPKHVVPMHGHLLVLLVLVPTIISFCTAAYIFQSRQPMHTARPSHAKLLLQRMQSKSSSRRS